MAVDRLLNRQFSFKAITAMVVERELPVLDSLTSDARDERGISVVRRSSFKCDHVRVFHLIT